jgi:hypothetical protein
VLILGAQIYPCCWIATIMCANMGNGGCHMYSWFMTFNWIINIVCLWVWPSSQLHWCVDLCMVVFYSEQIAMLVAFAYNDAPCRRMPFYILTFYMGLHCFVGCYRRVQAMLMSCWAGFGEKFLSGYWWSELYLFVQWAPMWGTLVFGKWVWVIGWQTAPLKSGTSLQHPCQCRFE